MPHWLRQWWPELRNEIANWCLLKVEQAKVLLGVFLSILSFTEVDKVSAPAKFYYGKTAVLNDQNRLQGECLHFTHICTHYNTAFWNNKGYALVLTLLSGTHSGSFVKNGLVLSSVKATILNPLLERTNFLSAMFVCYFSSVANSPQMAHECLPWHKYTHCHAILCCLKVGHTHWVDALCTPTHWAVGLCHENSGYNQGLCYNPMTIGKGDQDITNWLYF